MKSTIGIDEVGRGSIAGPLCVCALKLTQKSDFKKVKKIKDSKKLSARKRALIFDQIKREAKEGKLTYALSYTSPQVIDKIGISLALKQAVSKALKKINTRNTDRVLLDGALYAPHSYIFQRTIIKGDETEIEIALASIAAKVSRDKRMVSYSKKYPEYSFDAHKGYGTEVHYRAIAKQGLSSIHRRSFCKNL